jgi:spore photoproduct lyase
MKIEKVNRKSMIIRDSGRSSDYITPSFGYGCLLNCSYCYMKRHLPKGLSIAQNANQILTEVNNHSYFLANAAKPNQTHAEYMTYDIACNEDFALHRKHHNWQHIFDFFKKHPVAMATLATKIIPIEFLEYDPNKKVRIRFSLMPQVISSELEPNTPAIIDRIKAVNAFIEAGYDVHLNFSPVVVYERWLYDYKYLFQMCNDYIDYKDEVKCEVIFLTHNEKKHHDNLVKNVRGERLLWTPSTQEAKTSQYGGRNVRYRRDFKALRIQEFRALHKSVIPWNTIRYIF